LDYLTLFFETPFEDISKAPRTFSSCQCGYAALEPSFGRVNRKAMYLFKKKKEKEKKEERESCGVST